MVDTYRHYPRVQVRSTGLGVECVFPCVDVSESVRVQWREGGEGFIVFIFMCTLDFTFLSFILK